MGYYNPLETVPDLAVLKKKQPSDAHGWLWCHLRNYYESFQHERVEEAGYLLRGIEPSEVTGIRENLQACLRDLIAQLLAPLGWAKVAVTPDEQGRPA